jgi:hypothetical protein
MAAAAAIILRRERDIVNLYRSAGATDAGTARDPGDLDVDRGTPFRLLVKHAVLRDAGHGRFYLDEPSWQALHWMRRRLVLVMLLLLLVLIVGGAFGARAITFGHSH